MPCAWCAVMVDYWMHDRLGLWDRLVAGVLYVMTGRGAVSVALVLWLIIIPLENGQSDSMAAALEEVRALAPYKLDHSSYGWLDDRT